SFSVLFQQHRLLHADLYRRWNGSRSRTKTHCKRCLYCVSLGDGMELHLFRDGDSDVFAFTTDRTGECLPCTQESHWQFLETLAPVRFAWGQEEFGEVYDAIAATSFYLFEGEVMRS